VRDAFDRVTHVGRRRLESVEELVGLGREELLTYLRPELLGDQLGELIRSLTAILPLTCPVTVLPSPHRTGTCCVPTVRRERMSMLAELLEVVIGVDTHKDTHTAAVVDARTGGVLTRLTVTADPDG
jgi:hypothetical protein